MHPSIETIVFDFDGTLVDSAEAVKQAFEETLSEIDEAGETDRINPRRPFGETSDTLTCHTLSEMFRAEGISRSDEIDHAIRIYNRRYLELSPKRSKPFPRVSETLGYFRNRGIILGIATNERRENLDALLPAFGLDAFFSATICENEVTRSKPDPEMLTALLKRLGADSSKTLLVGDSILDMEMGQRAGCRTCGAGYGTHSAEMLKGMFPDHLIGRPKELIGIVDAYFFNRT